MLDYDGTLAPFHRERDRAVPYPGVTEILDRIEGSKKTRLVIISGRTIADLVPLLGMKNLPEMWGSHGWEQRRPGGSHNLLPASKKHLKGLADAGLLVEKETLINRLEEKPRSIALHWRGASEKEISFIRGFVIREWSHIALDYGLEIKDFDGGIELRVPGRNKGVVVKIIIDESPPESFFAYLGDDLSDEDAFEAIEGHGTGILVGEKKGPTKASLHLRAPEELLQFLHGWDDATRKKGG